MWLSDYSFIQSKSLIDFISNMAIYSFNQKSLTVLACQNLYLMDEQEMQLSPPSVIKTLKEIIMMDSQRN